MKLSADQLAILKKVSSAPVSYEGLTEADKNVLKYLSKMKYVRIESISVSRTAPGFFGLSSEPISASITEKGKSFLATLEDDDLRYKQTKLRANISLGVSILAVVIAILTLIIK